MRFWGALGLEVTDPGNMGAVVRHCSGQIKRSRPITSSWAPNFGSVLVSGNGAPAISGKLCGW